MLTVSSGTMVTGDSPSSTEAPPSGLVPVSVASSDLSPIGPGEIIEGRYQILHPIARGGMGVVFAARGIAVGIRVALKFVRFENSSRTERGGLDREAECSADIEHENIAQVLDRGISRDRPFLVVEYVDGLSLKDHLEEHGPFEPLRAVKVMEQLCRGMSAAHARGIVHRDLKSSNIMLTKHADGSDLVKILDFGVARKLPLLSEETLVTASGCPGTIDYMAPEVARGTHGGDPLTDIYSMGVVLYEMLSGRRPHEGPSSNAVLYSIVSKAGVSLETREPQLPESLLAVVRSCLADDRTTRPPSVLALLASLEDCLPRCTADLRDRPSDDQSVRQRRGISLKLSTLMLGAVFLGAAVGFLTARATDLAKVQRRAAGASSNERPLLEPVRPRLSNDSRVAAPLDPEPPGSMGARTQPRSISREVDVARSRSNLSARQMRLSPPSENSSSKRSEADRVSPAVGLEAENPYE